jgi:hypothetical protein
MADLASPPAPKDNKPKRTYTRREQPKREIERTGDKSSHRADAATTTISLVATGLTMIGIGMGKPVLLDDGGTLALHAEDIGREAAKQADQNDFVGGLLDKLDMLNAFAGLALVLMPVGLQIMVNHRAASGPEGKARVEELAPALEQFGVLPPELLRTKIAAEHKKKMAEMKAAMLRQQRDAESELADLEREMSAAQNGNPSPDA